MPARRHHELIASAYTVSMDVACSDVREERLEVGLTRSIGALSDHWL